jgi:protein LTV1
MVEHQGTKTKQNRAKAQSLEEEKNENEGGNKLRHLHSQTIARPRDESKEAKKVRKAVVKAERQARRADKKSTREQFGAEIKVQMKTIGNKERRVKKL